MTFGDSDDKHLAVCMKCGWARVGNSLSAAQTKADDHGYDHCPTTILPAGAIEQARALQRGDLVAMDADDADHLGELLRDAELAIQGAKSVSPDDS